MKVQAIFFFKWGKLELWVRKKQKNNYSFFNGLKYLKDNELISEKFATNIDEVRKFRNILAHTHQGVTMNQIKDFESMLDAILEKIQT